MITVFYDGTCGLCRREISYYKNIAPQNIFHWVDVTKDFDTLKQHNISIVSALKHIHVLDESHVMHKGINSFIVVWKQLKGWHWLAKILSFPVINFLANHAYNGFAWLRFKYSPHCKVALKEHEKS